MDRSPQSSQMTMLELRQRFTIDPEKKLGPNYGAVFNFWAFVDNLTPEQENIIMKRYSEFEADNGYFGYATHLVEYTNRVIENEAVIWQEVYGEARDFRHIMRLAITWATHEVICMHELIADGKPIVVLPLFDCAWERINETKN